MYLEENRALKGVFTHLPIEDVYYGDGAIESLGVAMDQFGMKRALMITGTTLATKTDLVNQVKHHSGGRICGVFYETVQHVHRGSVLRAMDMARSLGADSIISFGGGTPNDTGKAVVAGLSAEIKMRPILTNIELILSIPVPRRFPIFRVASSYDRYFNYSICWRIHHFAGITDSKER